MLRSQVMLPPGRIPAAGHGLLFSDHRAYGSVFLALVDGPRSGGPKWLDTPLSGPESCGSFGGADLRKDARAFPAAAIGGPG
jgi:hypothetical protein